MTHWMLVVALFTAGADAARRGRRNQEQHVVHHVDLTVRLSRTAGGPVTLPALARDFAEWEYANPWELPLGSDRGGCWRMSSQCRAIATMPPLVDAAQKLMRRTSDLVVVGVVLEDTKHAEPPGAWEKDAVFGGVDACTGNASAVAYVLLSSFNQPDRSPVRVAAPGAIDQAVQGPTAVLHAAVWLGDNWYGHNGATTYRRAAWIRYATETCARALRTETSSSTRKLRAPFLPLSGAVPDLPGRFDYVLLGGWRDFDASAPATSSQVGAAGHRCDRVEVSYVGAAPVRPDLRHETLVVDFPRDYGPEGRVLPGVGVWQWRFARSLGVTATPHLSVLHVEICKFDRAGPLVHIPHAEATDYLSVTLSGKVTCAVGLQGECGRFSVFDSQAGDVFLAPSGALHTCAGADDSEGLVLVAKLGPRSRHKLYEPEPTNPLTWPYTPLDVAERRAVAQNFPPTNNSNNNKSASLLWDYSGGVLGYASFVAHQVRLSADTPSFSRENGASDLIVIPITGNCTVESRISGGAAPADRRVRRKLHRLAPRSLLVVPADAEGSSVTIEVSTTKPVDILVVEVAST